MKERKSRLGVLGANSFRGILEFDFDFGWEWVKGRV